MLLRAAVEIVNLYLFLRGEDGGLVVLRLRIYACFNQSPVETTLRLRMNLALCLLHFHLLLGHRACCCRSRHIVRCRQLCPLLLLVLAC